MAFKDKAADLKYRLTREALRQRPFSQELNFSAMVDRLYEIKDKADEINWANEELDEILGDELAADFRIQHADLSQSCYMAINDVEQYMQDFYDPDEEERGASLFDALVSGSGGATADLYSYDSSEDEYQELTGWQAEYAERCAAQRVASLTKARMLELMGDVLWLTRTYMGIVIRYQALAGIYELIHEEACAELDTVKGVEQLYTEREKLRAAGDYALEAADRKYDQHLAELPPRVWLI